MAKMIHELSQGFWLWELKAQVKMNAEHKITDNQLYTSYAYHEQGEFSYLYKCNLIAFPHNCFFTSFCQESEFSLC